MWKRKGKVSCKDLFRVILCACVLCACAVHAFHAHGSQKVASDHLVLLVTMLVLGTKSASQQEQ